MGLPHGNSVLTLGYVGDTDTKGYEVLDIEYDGWLVIYKDVWPSGRIANNSKSFPTREEADKFAETIGDNLVSMSQYLNATGTQKYFN